MIRSKSKPGTLTVVSLDAATASNHLSRKSADVKNAGQERDRSDWHEAIAAVSAGVL